MCRDLLHRISEGVESLKALVAQDLILNAHYGFQKDIVERLGFDAHIQLLHPKTETPRLLFQRAKDNVESGLSQARKLTESGVMFQQDRNAMERGKECFVLQW